MRLLAGFDDGALADGPVGRAENDGDRFARVGVLGLGVEAERFAGRADLGQREGLVARQFQHRRQAQHFDHALEVAVFVVVRGRAGLPDFQRVGVRGQRRGQHGFDAERAGDARDVGFDFGFIDQHFFRGRLVVGDGFQRDVRHDAADFLALPVLFAGIDEAAGRAALRVFQLVVGVSRGEQALAGEGERYAGRINGDPATPPLL